MFVQVDRGSGDGPRARPPSRTGAGKPRHHGDRCRMSCRELLLGVSARGPEGAVTALVRAVPAAGIAVRPLEKS
jgi:hypothetical protein